MATRTTFALADAVLKLCNMKRVGEEMDEEALAEIREVWSGLNAELTDKGRSYWDDEAIPLEVFRRIVWLVSIEIAPGYGVMQLVLQSISQPDAEAARHAVYSTLDEHVASRPNYETMRGEFF